MAISLLSTIIVRVALLVTPVVYLLLNVFRYLRDLYHRSNAIRQWPGPPIHWLYGNYHQHPLYHVRDDNRTTIGNDNMKWYLDMVAEYPRGYYFYATLFLPIFEANHPECVKTLLKSGDPKPLSGAGYNLLMPWLGDGLLLSKGKKWARNRRLLTPAFHFEILKPYVTIYNKSVETLKDKMRSFAESGESFEVTKNVSLCTLDILLQCVFSQRTNCQIDGEKHPYVATVKRLSIDVVERLFTPLHISDLVYFNLTARGRKHKKDCDYVHKMAEDIINQRRVELKGKATDSKVSSGRKYIDFLDILISARDENGVGLTDLEIRNEVDTFLFEGHDTTASGLTWILYSLAKSPEHQRKVQKEVDEIFEAKDDEVLEWDDLSKLKYLTLCMKEAMRIYPPVILVSRVLEKDTEVDGRILKAGTQADVQIYALHHHPDFWDRHDEFIPERFLPENSKDRDPFCYVPFAAGPRNCIGQNFALTEEKVILAHILRNFELTLDPNHQVNFGLELISKPSTDIKLKLKLRK